MKRYGNLYHRIYNIDNLILADKRARRDKGAKDDILLFDQNKSENLLNLQESLRYKLYKTSSYEIFTIKDPKEREIYKLPYFPDRIAHHAIMNVLEPIFVSTFTSNTYNCIKGRGIHKASYNLREALRDEYNTKYCLKFDIKKFYPNIDHDILKGLLRRKFKDRDLLYLLDEIIDSTNGVPIGNYLSQFFANFYLCYFDHWIKEILKERYYFRYCDDIVILSNSKEHLHKIFGEITEYLKVNLKLEIKSSYQIFPVDIRGIDFVGYKHYRRYVLLRKGIKRRFINMIKYNNNYKSITSYNGWLIHCDSINLRNKYLKTK